MNIFNKYGIKEVADVTFYSITRIGDEEFYTPVLFFDTLKVSTLDKSVETVNAKGGKGNGKILSWNFGKELKLKLEDALFSQMSLDMFMNGRVMAKLSDWTSAIAKLSVANKYGQKNYSIKAFPSPKLTKAEEEIVFRCAQTAGYDPHNGYFGPDKLNYDIHTAKYLYDTEGQDEEEDYLVAENRKLLMEQYYKRTQPTPRERDIAQYIDCNNIEYDGIQIIIQEDLNELRDAKKVASLAIGDKWGGWRDLTVSFRKKSDENYSLITKQSRGYVTPEDLAENPKYGLQGTVNIVVQLSFSIEKRVDGLYGIWAYISADNFDTLNDDGMIAILKQVLTGYNKNEDTRKEDRYNPTFEIGNEFFLSHLPYFIFPRYLEVAIGDLCWCDQQDNFYLAMPQKIIDTITAEIDTFSKTGYFENDLYEAQTIDRFEKCLVTKRSGLKIDLVQQTMNIKKQYRNDIDNYTVFYDAKTMLPFMTDKLLDEKIYSQKCIRYVAANAPNEEMCKALVKSYLKNQYDDDWVDSLTEDDYIINRIIDNRFGYQTATEEKGENLTLVNDLDDSADPSNPEERDNVKYVDIADKKTFFIYFNITKRDYMTLKYGTVYYKWSRTIDDDNTDTTFIGTDLSIDTDTFSGEYMIVGETYIREQKTGKDQRYQLLLSRAAISASTKIQLQASGAPTTFSIDVDVLTPLTKKKSMIELRQYNVEEDKREGGYKIIPQNKKHSYTPAAQFYEEIVIDNKEIY